MLGSRFWRVRVLGLLTALATMTACVSCSNDGSDTGGASKTLTILGTVEPTTFDSGQAGDYQNYALNMLMFDSLAEQDSNGDVHMVLADSITLEADKLTYTIKLKSGIEFSDGTPFNSAAVCYTVDQLIDPNSTKAHASTWAAVESCTEVDDLTVALKTDAPYADFVTNVLAGGIAGQTLSPSMAKYGAEADSHPIGTGPYKLKEWVRGDHVELVPNENYSGDVLGDKPYYKKVIWRIVPEATTRILLMKQGKADFAYEIPGQQASQLDGVEGVKLMNAPGLFQWFLLNPTIAPFDNPDVRKAANYAVDKPAVIKAALAGQAQPADGVLNSGFPGFVAVGQYKYNPDKAKSLLEKANAVGAKVVIDAPSGRYPSDKTVAQSVAEYLNKAGFDATVQLSGDWPAYQELIGSDKPQMAMLGWQPSDAGRTLYRQVTCSAGQWNLGPYCNPQVDQLVDQANSEVDPDARKQLLTTLQKTVFDDALGLYMYSVNLIVAVDSSLKGIVIWPTTLVNLRGARPK